MKGFCDFKHDGSWKRELETIYGEGNFCDTHGIGHNFFKTFLGLPQRAG